jgi:phosphatidylserine/phosphatidylglycerophosphate/cardiolipin synthase-like enzyme
MVTVYVPCDVVTVRVRLGYQETLTPIEQIVLRAVHAGAATLHELADALGLSQRLALDVVQDLWRAGYLRLVRSYAGLEVTDVVAGHLAAGTLTKLASAETLDDQRQIMIDKLSGYVMPLQGPGAPALPKFAVPVENSTVRIADASIPELLEAVERGLDAEEQKRERDPEERGRGPQGRRRHVLGAHLATDQLASGGRRWLPLEVRTAIDSDTDQLTVTVVGGTLPEQYRAEASRQLTRLVASRPNDQFVQTLRGQARPGLLSAPSAAQAVGRLREQAVTAAGIPAGQRNNWHRELRALHRQLVGLIDDQIEHEVSAKVVTGAEHPVELLRLIDSARAQLVLVGPWVRYDALNAITPALRAAVRRGVQVVLLWGIQYEEQLDKRVSGLLYDTILRTGARTVAPDAASEDNDGVAADSVAGADGAMVAAPPSRSWFLVPETPARTHAKLAVADDRCALVTSWNLLNRSAPELEVGVRITAPSRPGSAGDGSHPIREILRWARTAVPGYEMSRLVLVNEQDIALRLPPEESPSVPWQRRGPSELPELAEPPDAPGDGTDENAEKAAREWSEGWLNVAGHAAALLAARSHPPARVVLDGAHRDLLWHAVRVARHRLVVTSDRLSRQVVDERMLSALETAADRGVEVTLVYGRPHEKELPIAADGAALANVATETERALQTLADRYPNTFRVTRTGTHAKVLVWDDEVVVSSFNFLSFEGTYASGAAHRQRSELGVRLSGRSVADDAVRAVGVTTASPSDGQTAPPLPEPDPSFSVAQRVLNAVAAGATPADAVAEHFSADTDAWRALDRLAENAGRDVLRVAAARCLGGRPDAAPLGRRERWARWLVEDLWSDGRYTEAALLRATIEDADFRPRPQMTLLAAARGRRLCADVLGDAWTALDPPTPPDFTDVIPANTALDAWQRWMGERTAVLAAAMERVLFAGDRDAATLVQLEGVVTAADSAGAEEDSLAEGWSKLAEAVVAYAEASYHRPLPLDLMRADLDRRSDREAQAAAWARLDAAFERAEHTPFHNTDSLRTHLHLFERSEGVFARLKVAVVARSPDDLRNWLSTMPARGDVGQLIDEAAAVVAPGKQPMYGDYRKRYIRLLESIVGDVRTVVELYTGDNTGLAPGMDATELLAAARPVAQVCATKLADLISATEATAGPEASFVREVLESFKLLREWAELGSVQSGGPS